MCNIQKNDSYNYLLTKQVTHNEKIMYIYYMQLKFNKALISAIVD